MRLQAFGTTWTRPLHKLKKSNKLKKRELISKIETFPGNYTNKLSTRSPLTRPNTF